MNQHMHKYLLTLLACSMTLLLAAQNPATGAPNKDSLRTIIVFFDGLRPDYITQEAMPNLYAFSKRGCYGTKHHSVFPTVTRVNASSYSTGSYPGTHGLLGNTVYFPQVDPAKGLNTGDAADLNKIAVATDGHLLTAISLGEVLKANGHTMMVFSSGSTGQALMQNHTVSGGGIINPGMILPSSLQEKVVSEVGPIPARAKPNSAQHIWITDALLKYGLASDGPLVSAIWFSDPDGAAHSDGIGSVAAVASIRSVDEQFGRILQELEKRNLSGRFNILVSTDHGFVTHIGKKGLAEFLISEGFKKDALSQDVVVAEGAIYVKDHNEEIIRKIVTALQSQPWVGAVFTKGKKQGDHKGRIEGTLSFESIHWDHADRAADILVDKNWNDEKNNFGYAGTSYSGGVAGHGGLSPYEVHIPLVAAGPSFKSSFRDPLPTSNVDIVPTLLQAHGIAIPAGMDGRVMTELLAGNTSKTPAVKIEKVETSSSYGHGKYRLTLQRTIIGKYQYVDFAKVIREEQTAAQ